MYSLHELLCADGRVLNRHAGKMYGFIPGIITAVHDPKEKRHQRGYVKVHFPGLQDVDGPDAPILPWARLAVPNAGGMIDSKKTKKKKVKCPVWDRTPKTIDVEWDEPVIEPIYETRKEKTTTTDTKFENFQKQLDIHFQVARPRDENDPKYQGDLDFEEDKAVPQVFMGGDGPVKAQCKALVTEVQKYLKEAEDGGVINLHLDAHTSATGTGHGNLLLSQRRAHCITWYLEKAIKEAGLDKKVGVKGTGHGRRHCGQIRDKKNPNNFIDNPKHSPGGAGQDRIQTLAQCKSAQNLPEAESPKPSEKWECKACRRVDATFDMTLLKKKVKTEEKEKKVKVGEKRSVKHHKGKKTIYEMKLKEIELEIEVPDPGPPSGSGFYTPPQIGDEVVCAFEHGDMRFPYVLGSVWNGKAKLPDPTTPADDKRDKKGPQTPAMKGDSLVGGGGKNQTYYFKSRSGNLVSLDDKSGVVRIQERSGMSTIQLSGKKIEIMQTTGNIYFFAKKTMRFDCKDFEVYAKKNIWQHSTKDYTVKAGQHNTIEVKGTWALTSGAECKFKSNMASQIVADKMVAMTAKGGGGVAIKSMMGVSIGSKDAKLDIDAKSEAKFMAVAKILSNSGGGDAGVKSDGMIDQSALMKIKWKGGKILLNAGGKPPGALTLGKIVGAVLRGAKALAGKIAPGATAAISNAVAKANKLATGVMDKVNASPLGGIVGDLGKAAMDGKLDANAVKNAVKKEATKQAKKVTDKAVAVVDEAAQEIVEKLPEGPARQAAQLAKNAAMKEVAGKAQEANQAVGDATGKVADKVEQKAKEVADAIQEGAENAAAGDRGAGDDVRKKAKEAAGEIREETANQKDRIEKKTKDVADAAQNGPAEVKNKADDLEREGKKAADAMDKAGNKAADDLEAAGDKAAAKLDKGAEDVRKEAAKDDGKPAQQAPAAHEAAHVAQDRQVAPPPDPEVDRFGNKKPQDPPRQAEELPQKPAPEPPRQQEPEKPKPKPKPPKQWSFHANFKVSRPTAGENPSPDCFQGGMGEHADVTAKSQKVAADLKTVHDHAKVIVDGHTSTTGGAGGNKGLSERRANMIVKYLVSAGVPQNKISVHGFGETKAGLKRDMNDTGNFTDNMDDPNRGRCQDNSNDAGDENECPHCRRVDVTFDYSGCGD